jgi:membrane protein YdbS with pleckstrin-like domain
VHAGRSDMKQEEFTIRKTPFLFMKWLVIVEFFFAALPFLAATLTSLRQAYNGSTASGMVSYTLLVAIILTILQVLILTIVFVAWYLPVYQVDRKRIVHRRANLFEDRMLVETSSIAGIDVQQGRIGRRLDYGTLAISTEEASERARVRNIPSPAHYAKLIKGLVKVGPSPTPVTEPRPVEELISGGEGQYVEFKSSLMWDYHRQAVNKALYEPVMKNIVGFLNASGGSLLIGVADDGEILGLEADYRAIRKPNADGFENVFNMAFNNMIGVEFRRFVNVSFPEQDGKQICVVTVRPASEPAFLSHKGKETFYVRAGNASQPLSVSKATKYIQGRFRQ